MTLIREDHGEESKKKPWDGVEFRLREAGFFRQEMSRDLAPARSTSRRAYEAYYASSPGTIVGNAWAPKFYYHLDAFLQAVRSVLDIIQANFGEDRHLSKWIKTLPKTEQQRRGAFQRGFQQDAQQFLSHPGTQARKVAVHREGTPSVEVTVLGRWGVIHRGGPTRSIPITDSGSFNVASAQDDPLPWIPKPAIPLEPKESDFSLVVTQADGTDQKYPLFDMCDDYLVAAKRLVISAKAIDAQVDNGQPLNPPPKD